MQKPQFDLCCEVLRRLRAQRVLPYLVLTGSWCLLLYRQYFERDELFSSLRTRDMDFLVPIPFTLRDKVNLPELFKDLGFLTEYKGAAGYMQLIHPEVMLKKGVRKKVSVSTSVHFDAAARGREGRDAMPSLR